MRGPFRNIVGLWVLKCVVHRLHHHRRKTTKRIRSCGDLDEEEIGEEGKEGTLKTKIEETLWEISSSSDEADAQRREEEAGGGDLVTLTPEVLDLEENVKMDFSRKMDDSSDWRERGSRSRDSSTSMSTSDKRKQFHEFKSDDTDFGDGDSKLHCSSN